MLGSTLIPLIVLGFAGELKPLAAENGSAPDVQNSAVSDPVVSQAFLGVDSKLDAPVRLQITDEQVWTTVWFRHHGIQAIRGRNPHPVPEIDFSKHMVVGIVEKAARFRHGIQVERIEVGKPGDTPIVTFDYSPQPGSKSDQPRPQNVFGFFVIPRYQPQLVIHRQSGRGWKQVKSIHALPPGNSVEIRVVAATPVTAPELAPGLTTQEAQAAPEPDKPCIQPSPGKPGRPTHSPAGSLNIGFALDPYQGNYDGAVGSPGDIWNFVDVGTTAIDYMRHPNATSSTARLRVSRHDGEWSIKGHSGIFQGYIYHNCQCVDLEVTVLDLAPDRYKAYVYAHGDAPNQNAKIEVIVGERSIGQKATANDGTWEYRSTEFKEGVQYVSFEFDVPSGEPVRIISHRDGSGYSMFNAIQLVPVTKAPSSEEEPDDGLPPDRSPRSPVEDSVQSVEGSKASS